MSEKALERHLARRAVEEGGWALKLFPTAVKGMPDRLLLLNGHVRFIEMKTATGRVSAPQRAVHTKLERLGHHVVILRTKDEIENLIEALKT